MVSNDEPGHAPQSDDLGRHHRQETVRWGWVSGCFAGGALLIALAFVVEAVWNWQGVSPSVLIEAGTALALAGVLFLLERRFTGRVERASERAAQRAAEQVETRVLERTDQLAARLDDLQAEVRQRAHLRAAEQDAKIAAMRDEVSYETVTAAMTEANWLAAIDDGRVTVQASHDPDGLALTFSWAEDRDFDHGRTAGPHLDVACARVEVEWRAGEPAADVGHRLIEELQRAGEWEGDATLDWGTTLRNLQRALAMAVSSRRRDLWSWHLKGALIELVSETWALTDAGVEHFGQGLMVSETDFPEQVHSFFATSSPAAAKQAEAARTWLPDPPSGVDPVEWRRAVERGRSLFPRMRITDETWVPWGSAPEHIPGREAA